MIAVPTRCIDCAVRDVALCASMSDDELRALSDMGRRRVLPAGQVVSWAGEPSSSCASVVSGALKATASTADGREQIVGLLFPGDFVGQPFQDDASLTVTTLVATDLCIYPRAGFEHVVDDHPRMERLLLERTLASLSQARGRMLSLARRSAKERVAGFLLELADHTGESGPDGIRVRIPISRGDLADYLGLTIETVSRQLTLLKASGVLGVARGGRDCTIRDRARLEGVAGPQ
ncbi:Crp/Fnr family transcriptional regulator [Sphingomonas floccifaciens]|uniref:Crp/Fnr family transcriptional regulator n=1 Tax=Sphingomonas floccifaciens TaxID=1844115 RepID=A0ABW4NBM7_9SPHN